MNDARKYAIAYKGLRDGVHDFEFAIGRDLFERFENQEITDAEGVAKVRLERAGSRMCFEVGIAGTVTAVCDRCLGACKLPVEARGVLPVEVGGAPGYDGEVLMVSAAEDFVDLAHYIYESVVLALPLQRVHPEGGCDEDMLRRFNKEQ